MAKQPRHLTGKVAAVTGGAEASAAPPPRPSPARA